MNLGQNPVIRVLAVMVAIAVCVRLIFELIEPVAPYLLGGLIAFVVFRLVSWYRGRW